jgi:HK97 family phage major capsid protein
VVAETISKPESALTFTIDSAPVRTIAHWIPAAKQILDDFAQLQAYIDQRLLDGLKDNEDIEILMGDGTGQHLSGLITEATAYDTARNVASDTRIDKVNHAISQVEDENLEASAIVLHQRDWRAIQLTKEETGGANTGMYLLGGPRGDAMPMLWGLPVATVNITAMLGKFMVGAFSSAAAVWDREDARVDISTEHAEYFVRNMVAIRAEERLALTVYRTNAFVYGAF